MCGIKKPHRRPLPLTNQVFVEDDGWKGHLDTRVDGVCEQLFRLAGGEDEVEVKSRGGTIVFLFRVEEGITMPEIRFFFGEESFGEVAGGPEGVEIAFCLGNVQCIPGRVFLFMGIYQIEIIQRVIFSRVPSEEVCDEGCGTGAVGDNGGGFGGWSAAGGDQDGGKDQEIKVAHRPIK